jgi:ubiquinone/menaquinone biosynthesis C-methylase UbiE
MECEKCNFHAAIEDGVIAMLKMGRWSAFDDTYRVMEKTNKIEAVWQFCYEQQARVAEASIKSNAVVLDVGCGPSVPYDKPAEWVVMGLDPSYQSIQANKDVDVRIFGSATEIPLKDRSINAIFCFYSIHHMTGNKKSENESILEKTFAEFNRVIAENGVILIFDMSPWWPAWEFQKMIWDFARRRLGPKLDMFFWHKQTVETLGRKYFPAAKFKKKKFTVSPFITFPPVFNLPWLKVPRFAYPFSPYLYAWEFTNEKNA